MRKLDENRIYSRSGTIFSRSLFLLETLGSGRTVFVFDSHEEEKKALPVLGHFLAAPIKTIASEWDLLRFLDEKNGLFSTTTGVFDASVRFEYKRTKLGLRLERSKSYQTEDIINRLLEMGYAFSGHLSKERSYKLEGGELHIRMDEAVLIASFFGDELDELVLTNQRGEALGKPESFTVFSANSSDLPERAKSLDEKLCAELSDVFVVTFDLEFFELANELRSHLGRFLSFESTKDSESLEVDPLAIETLEWLEDLLRANGEKTRFYTRNPKTVEQFLSYNALPNAGIEKVARLPLESFESEGHIAVADDIVSRLFAVKRTRRSAAQSLDLLLSLAPNDYVVHFEHGIGIFRALIEKEINGAKREYVEIEYADNDRLYVPVTELYRLTKYLGDEKPTLHRLGGNVWKTALANTEDEVAKTAAELLEVYAKRKVATGFAFPKFRKEESEFRARFPYQHTPDQLSSIEEIFGDMEHEEPMDRLLSGDVGFGKTEVAMNAAYKAVLAGKQVAVISPLVVLAYEHADSFRKRFEGTGMCIEIMTRMTPARDATRIMKSLAEGTIDIVLGTHRLLSEDIAFKRLGLLIVDEEHKFGVIDKERITKMKANLDILSLSATPIPRSLNMALSGLRKISMLTTPPPRKKPIRTLVAKWNEEAVKEAIHAELERGGQVIFLHNRIASLEGTAKELHRIAGKKLRIAITHGQMDPVELEDRIVDFKEGKYDILLTTTVIENGVNFLRANTILIDHADEFGLAQLHQLRGRVGRKDVEAHCYLLYRKDHLPEDSKKRLLAIVENSHLGAGFEIAMRDLEIRGAGEILGIKQSGRAKETGISLYLKLLENKIEELKSGTKPHTVETKIELDVETVIDEELFATEHDKIQFYRSLESVDDVEDLESAEESFARGHEEVPQNVRNLFLLLKARIYLDAYGVTGVKKVLKDYVFDFKAETTTETIRRFLDNDDKQAFLVQSLVRVRVAKDEYRGDLDFLEKLVYSLEKHA